MSGSLRKIAVCRIDKAMKRHLLARMQRRVTVPLAVVFGLSPLFLYLGGFVRIPVYGKLALTLSSEIIGWTELLWGGTATMFALPVAICALITGVSPSAAGRKQVFRKFRRRAFDSVIVLGLTYLGSSAWMITHAIRVQADVSFLEDILYAMLLGELVLLFGIGALVFTTANILSSASEAELRKERLLEHTYETIYGLALEHFGQSILDGWAKEHKVSTSSILMSAKEGHRVRSDRDSMVRDVNLRRLTKWVKSLKAFPPNQDLVAVIGFNLNKWFFENQAFAIIVDEEKDSNISVKRCLKLRSPAVRTGVPELVEELTLIRDDAVVDCREERRTSFRQALEIYEAFFEAVLIYDRQLRLHEVMNLSDEPTFMITWIHPLIEIGTAVAKTESESLLNIWLFFIRSLLRRARKHAYVPSSGEILKLFSYYATDSESPADIFWLHLKDFNLELDVDLERDLGSPMAMSAVKQMADQYVYLAPRLLTYTRSEEFGNICRWTNQIGRSILQSDNRHIRMDSSIGDIQEYLLATRQKMWMLYGAWVIKRFRNGQMDRGTAEAHFEFVRGQFQTLQELLQTYNRVGIGDEITWNMTGESAPSGDVHFVDPHSGAHWVVFLVGIYLVSKFPPQDLRPDPNSLMNYEAMFKHAIEEVQTDPDQWTPFLGISPQGISQGIGEFKDRFVTSTHEGELLRYQRLADTPLDTDMVDEFLDRAIESVTNVGLRLFEQLDEGGRVQRVSDVNSDMRLMLRFETLPKDGFVNSNDYVEFIMGPRRPIWINDNAFILSPYTNHDFYYAKTYDATVKKILASLQRFEQRGMPASHIIVHYDWHLVQVLQQQAGFVHEEGERHAKIGTLNEVPVYQSLALSERTILVTNLTEWLELTFCPERTNRGRFFAELREPTSLEIAEWIKENPSGLSRAGIAFTDDQRQIVLKSHLVYQLLEPIGVSEISPDACIVIKYEVDRVCQ